MTPPERPIDSRENDPMSEAQAEVEALIRLARAGQFLEFKERASEVHASDLSDALAALDEATQLSVVQHLGAELVSEALAEMEPEERPSSVLNALSPEHAADIIDELASDDAADVLADMQPEHVSTILKLVEDRKEIEELLRYGEETAGGIMAAEVVVVNVEATAAEAIDEIRRQSEEVEDFFQVYCVDDNGRLAGVLPVQKVVCVPKTRRVGEIMESPPAVVKPNQDQEEVARLMARYNVAAVPVVDDDGKLLGRVTFDDVIDVVEAEQTEDLLKFSGASGDELLAAGWGNAVKNRLPWLLLNLLTASIAAFTVWHFQETLEAVIILAAVGPVVAGLGGNAGTQALAVTVRRVALGLVPAEQSTAILLKEILVGLINGVVIGAIVASVAVALGYGWVMGLVVLCALWGNIFVAGLAGASIPLLLEKLGLDPAVASSVFVTAFTDMFGYLIFLGLATKLLL